MTNEEQLGCPRSCGPLTAQRRSEGVLVELCWRCQGMWLDRGELEMLMTTDALDYRDELARIANQLAVAFARSSDEEAPARPCPRCQTMLLRGEHRYCQQVLVDTCPSCQGVWLDQGEGQALHDTFRASRVSTHGLFRSFWSGLSSVVGR